MSLPPSNASGSEIAALSRRAGPQVVSAIQKASASTGVDFSYLLEKASVESSFDTDAKSGSSSASGLYQFLDKTWMGMVKKYGEKYGLSDLAAKIDAKGHCSDAATKKHILDLRNDPETAACMAGEFAAENGRYLEKHTSGEVGGTELYLAHFMGAGGATGFLNAMKANPLGTAANLFPQAAAANRNVFYDKSGQPRTLAGVYDFFDKKFGHGDSAGAVQTASLDNQAATAPTMASLLQQSNDADHAMIALLSNRSPADLSSLATRKAAMSTASFSPAPIGTLNQMEVLLMAHLEAPENKGQRTEGRNIL